MLSIRIKKAQAQKAQDKKARFVGALAGPMGAVMALISGAVLPGASYANALQLAQGAALEPQTISVSGQGMASAPAKAAAIVFNFISTSYPEYSDTGELVSPPKLAEPSDLQSVVDAIKALGIASSVDVSRESFDYQYLQMIVKLDNPTKDRVDRIKEVMAEAAFAQSQFSYSPAGVAYVTDACDRLRQEARRDAIADARMQATELAEASGLKLGDLSAISGSASPGYYGPSMNSCASNLDEVLSYGAQYGFASQSSSSAEVIVNFDVYATYRVEE